jgi:hypothetical protein
LGGFAAVEVAAAKPFQVNKKALLQMMVAVLFYCFQFFYF